MTRNVIVLLICLIMNSCLPWSEEELGNGYYYLPDYKAIDIGYSGGSMIYQSFKKNCFKNEGILIKGGVLKVNKDNVFILVGQNKEQFDLNYKTEVYFYWIINKHSSDVYGPLVFEDYLERKAELGVPDNLKLKCEKEQ